MNTKAELQWWIEFAQKDLGRIKQKTRDKLDEQLFGRMEDYCSFWGASPDDSMMFLERDMDKIKAEQQEFLSKHQKGAAVFVSHLKEVLAKQKGESLSFQSSTGVQNLYIPFNLIDVKFTSFVTEKDGGEFSSYVSVETEPHLLVYFFMSMLMMGTKRENFKDCAYCGKLFLQVSREKKFCTRNCAANSAKG